MASAVSASDAIIVENLRKHYGKTQAVDGISFSVRAGEIFGMLGPNGAGKTTTIEMVEGLRVPDDGHITVLGLTQPKDERAIKMRIGIQLQATSLYPKLTVTELLDLFHTFYPGRQTLPTQELIRLVDLDEKKDTRSKALSGGRKRGKTIMLTTHYLEEAEQLCDRVAIVDHGRIIELGAPHDLIQRYFKEIAIEFQDGRGSTEAYLSLPGVSHATQEEGRVTVYSNDVPQTMAALLNRNTGEGQTLQGLSVRSATLEDVFLKLTGRALRD